MGSPATFNVQFLSVTGQIIDSPEDWQPAFIQVLVAPADWKSVRAESGAQSLPISLQVLNQEERVLANWPRSGPGNYVVQVSSSEATATVQFSIKPAKISDTALERMIDDLETRLPAAIALGLQRVGGLVGLKLLAPQRSTHAQEYQRLRRAVLGHESRPGLARILASIAADPHEVLRSFESWVMTERARRPVAARLVQAVAQGANFSQDGLPLRVLDSHVRHTYDVYENQLVNSFHSAVSRRLNRLAGSLARSTYAGAENADGEPNLTLRAVRDLQSELRRARQPASFLDEVGELNQVPDRVSMVLLNKPAYRAALERYYEFLRSVWVRLEEPALDAPLANFPYLYEIWGTLHVLCALINIAAELGFAQVGDTRLARRDSEGVFVRLVPNGETLVRLRHQTRGVEVRLMAQRSYGFSGVIQSISFAQIPDVTVEVIGPNGQRRLYLFDPKYKLESQQDAAAGPKKEDIDKMHAYRDAIRAPDGKRVVQYAGILYPGPSLVYRNAKSNVVEVAALTADPERPELLEEMLRSVLLQALGQ